MVQLFFMSASAAATMVAAASFSMTFLRGSQVDALARLLSTVALDMGRSRLSHSSAMLALGHWTSFLIDVL